ncbi:MAG TPA: DNA repair protein RecN [Syntrophorhabdaceae bacterium]|nr:DNA repair protein RecN [Syntrophorhabdaceae bacterium]HQI56688.1 DNA repair protein RecN [Syntrophorhabdaceae bacterium]
MGGKIAMLTFLKVKDFAIIDELKVEFENGFNVITGETGAGKSIIINALSTLMSAKVSSETIRTNARQAEVIGHFLNGSEELILKRVINASGRSRGFLNDEPVTLNRIEALGEDLINIYGQNEFQDLLDKGSYIRVIDNLLSLSGERAILAMKVKELKEVNTELEKKKKEIVGREKESALLEFQIEEIERENIRQGEEELIRERLKILKDAEKIKICLQGVSEGLYESDISVHTIFKTCLSQLKSLDHIDAIAVLQKRIESVSFDVEDIVSDVNKIEKTLSDDSDEMLMLEERLSRIYTLKDKYGKTFEDIQSYKDGAIKRLSYLKSLSEDISGLEHKKVILKSETEKLAQGLSEARREGALIVEKSIKNELGYLSMEGIKFTVFVNDKGAIDEEGRDDIEFLISTNPGEQLKPLRKIASGGELSRIMLAIKKAIGGEKHKTLIFDEIDAGIGGRVADLVGKRLKGLAKTHQVICITHLPQIAVYGDHHYLVEKQQANNVTKTAIKKLQKDERIAELARMMGGIIITDLTIKKAEEMLCNVEKNKY